MNRGDIDDPEDKTEPSTAHNESFPNFSTSNHELVILPSYNETTIM